MAVETVDAQSKSDARDLPSDLEAKSNLALDAQTLSESKAENKFVSPAELPKLGITDGKELEGLRTPLLPWTDKHPDGRLRMHMSYGQVKDAIVKLGEGPSHVARRLLGKDASEPDVKTLTKAMVGQYIDETHDEKVQHLRNGHVMLNERNVTQILSRIGDEETRNRIIDKLKVGWTEREPPVAVPFEAHGRPGETHPSRIDDPAQFLKDITAAAVDVKADQYRARGYCAAGFRLAINELPNWRIDGGTVDTSINKDINGWRSGLQMALDLYETGLFDKVPLKELGYKNLKQGYIVGRYHYPDYIKDHKSWDGEDMGDIDVYTPRHKPPNDDAEMYHDSFVLIPKGLKR